MKISGPVVTQLVSERISGWQAGSMSVSSRHRRGRRSAIAVILIACLPALLGCSVPVGGVTGLRLTADGHVSIVIGMCENRTVDGVELYDANEATPEQSLTRGSWSSSSGYTAVSWFVADSSTPGGRWTVERAWDGTVPAGRTYTVYAASADASWSTYPLAFTQRDIERLRPDRILAPVVELGGRRASKSLITEAEFTCARVQSR